MRTIALFTLIACCTLGRPTFASTTDDLTAQAEQAYANGNHAKALALFDSLNTTHTSASLLFNIGNCWSKLGDVPHAILFYERALRLAPGAEDIQANLDIERAKVVDRMNELPGFALASAWDKLQGGSDLDQWARRSLWACLAMALAAAASLFVRQRLAKRGLIALAAIALLATVASAALAAYRVEQVRNTNEAIIMEPKVDVLSEPREGASPAFVLHQGTKVQVLKSQDGWHEVKIPSGTVGWLPITATETI